MSRRALSSGRRGEYLWFVATAFLASGGAAQAAERLTRVESAYPYPTSDSEWILFRSNRFGQAPDIFRMRTDQSHVQNMTQHSASDKDPAVSPDGRRVAFVSLRDGNEEIYVMDFDGQGLHRVTHDAGRDIHPYWSPDGKRLIFNSTRHGDTFELYSMLEDGTDLKRVTNNDVHDTYASWSRDGKRIAFVRWLEDGRNPEVFVMNADGTGEKRLTNNPAFDGWPAWLPDGSLVFASDRATKGVFSLYRIALPNGVPELMATDPDGLVSYTTPQPAGNGTVLATGTIYGVGDIYRIPYRP